MERHKELAQMSVGDILELHKRATKEFALIVDLEGLELEELANK